MYVSFKYNLLMNLTILHINVAAWQNIGRYKMREFY